MLSIIYAYMGKKKEAGEFSILADKNASAETSGLRYHKFLGNCKPLGTKFLIKW